MDPTTSAQPWYRKAFDVLYTQVYRHRDEAAARREIDAVCELLGLTGGERALDVACGAGRHLRPMLDDGLDAFGVDLSSALLAEAVHDRRLGGRVAQADMRRLPFDHAFDLATNFFTSFGYFEDDADNAAALRSMVRSLRPGGRLLIDHANRDHVAANLIEQDTQRVDELTVDSRRRIADDRVVKRMTITDAAGRSERLTESVRLYRPAELGSMCEAAGLGGVRVFGSLAGEPLTPDSPRMIVLGARV